MNLDLYRALVIRPFRLISVWVTWNHRVSCYVLVYYNLKFTYLWLRWSCFDLRVNFLFFLFFFLHWRGHVRMMLAKLLSNWMLGLPRGLSSKESACKAGDAVFGSIPESGRSPGGGHGSPLQYSCLENSMDREAWWLHSTGWQTVRHDKGLSTYALNAYQSKHMEKQLWHNRCHSFKL